MTPSWWHRGFLGLSVAACVTALLLAGCGGGVGTGGTGSFASGPITGFGSVIVNDIVFDDISARVEDGEGSGRGRNELRLGMIVEVDSDAIQGGVARATRIRFDGALVGPVESVSLATGSFTMLGQTVTVDDTTVFDERLIGRLALLAPGGWVEVYALYDPALQRFRATRVEAWLRPLPPQVYRIRGIVSQLDTVAQTFRIGGAMFSYAGALNVPAGLTNGQFVRLALRTSPTVSGWSVVAFSTALRAVGDLDGVVIKGLVSSFTTTASFAVDGRPVNAGAAQFIDGTPALGLRVEVEGAVRGGVLQARTVKLRSDEQERERGFDLRGQIESVSTSVPRTFVLRTDSGIAITVNTNRTDLRYEPGGASAADLVALRRVEVKGVLAPNGSGIEATRIKFE